VVPDRVAGSARSKDRRVGCVSGLAFVASLVHSLAWPAGVVVAVVVLRRPIAVALGRGVRRARVGPVEVEFDQELAEVRKELQRAPELAQGEPAGATVVPPSVSLPAELTRLAAVSPRSAVLEAFARIEARLRELLVGAGMQVQPGQSGVALARLAYRHRLVSDETLNAIEGLAVLRNLAAHTATDEISAERALDYLALADAMLYPLRVRPAQGSPQ
jgi:hypothetical protein